VRELERERVTIQQAAARLGITESAVRKRVRKGDLRSEKVLEGNRERLYVFLDPDAAPFPEPFREKYMRSLEDRVKTLEDEVMRQQAIILSMSQSLRALTGAPTGGAKREPTRPPATSALTSRLGMSGWALAVGAIASLLTWVTLQFYEPPFLGFLGEYGPAGIILTLVLLPTLVQLLSGLWAGFTKRPSLPWFSSPHRWLRRGGRSVLEIATLAIGMPALVPLGVYFVYELARYGPTSPVVDFPLYGFLSLVAFATALLPFMSGAFLGNALRRVGLLGTPKEPPEGEEEGDEGEVWSAKKRLNGVWQEA
jgi:hypothetical protein